MERRDFIKGIFGAAGAAAALPFVANGSQNEIDPKDSELGLVEDEKDKLIWIQVISSSLNKINWCGQTWDLPEDSGKTYIVEASVIMNSSPCKEHNFIGSGVMTPIDTGHRHFLMTPIDTAWPLYYDSDLVPICIDGSFDEGFSSVTWSGITFSWGTAGHRK